MENKKIKKTNLPHVSNFWAGFAVGTLTVAGMAFFLGTKQGRATLKKILDISENLEDHVASVLQELEQSIEEKTQEVKHEIDKNQSTRLHSILNKIKDLSQKKKEIKKFFAKDGKIVRG